MRLPVEPIDIFLFFFKGIHIFILTLLSKCFLNEAHCTLSLQAVVTELNQTRHQVSHRRLWSDPLLPSNSSKGHQNPTGGVYCVFLLSLSLNLVTLSNRVVTMRSVFRPSFPQPGLCVCTAEGAGGGVYGQTTDSLSSVG